MQAQQPELPMKDVTPKKPAADDKAKKPAAAKAAPVRAKPAPAPPPPPAPARKKPTGKAVAVHEPQAPAQQKNMLQIIADIAASPDANPLVMRELLDMQKEIMADQAKRDFNAAFLALQSELPVIRRDGKIVIPPKDGKAGQSTPYATFNAINDVIRPLLRKHGFTLSFSTEPVGERLLVRGLLEGHGHERTTAFPLPAETSGSKNNVQVWGSSMSYGKRYCTVALLNIVSAAPEDRDTDGHPNKETFRAAKGGAIADVPDRETVSEDQAMKLRDLIEWSGVGTKKFCAHYGIAKVADLPADLFSTAEKDCKDYHANQQAKAARG